MDIEIFLLAATTVIELELNQMFTEVDSVSDSEIKNIRFKLSVTLYLEPEAELADAEFIAVLVIDDESNAANSENVIESILNELDNIEIDFKFIQLPTLECTAV